MPLLHEKDFRIPEWSPLNKLLYRLDNWGGYFPRLLLALYSGQGGEFFREKRSAQAAYRHRLTPDVRAEYARPTRNN